MDLNLILAKVWIGFIVIKSGTKNTPLVIIGNRNKCETLDSIYLYKSINDLDFCCVYEPCILKHMDAEKVVPT